MQHGTASTVLTAAHQYERTKFLSPIPLTRPLANGMSQLIKFKGRTVVPNLVQICPWGNG